MTDGDDASRPRIPYADLDDAQVAAGLSRDGKPLNLFRMLGHHSRLLTLLSRVGGTFLFRGTLPEFDRELVILRSAWTTGSDYEFRQHIAMSDQLGLDVARLRAIASGDEAGTSDEVLLVAIVDELGTDDHLSEPTWSSLAALYTYEQIVEVIAMVGFYRLLAGILNTLRVPVEDDLS